MRHQGRIQTHPTFNTMSQSFGVLVSPQKLLIQMGEVPKRTNYLTKARAELRQIGDSAQETPYGCFAMRSRHTQNCTGFRHLWTTPPSCWALELSIHRTFNPSSNLWSLVPITRMGGERENECFVRLQIVPKLVNRQTNEEVARTRVRHGTRGKRRKLTFDASLASRFNPVSRVLYVVYVMIGLFASLHMLLSWHGSQKYRSL